jgi:hypothetical protein
VSWFRRRRETLNEQLLREAGYTPEGSPEDAAAARELGGLETAPEPPQPEQEPRLRSQSDDLAALGVRSVGSPRPRAADSVTTVHVPELTGTEYAFTTLPDGTVIVDDDCDEDMSRLADAVEAHLDPPYRATGVRRDGDLWTVSARSIEVTNIAVDGDELELTSVAGERTYTVDGRPADQTLAPAGLAAAGAARSTDYAVHAVRLDGDLWQVDADPL